MTAWIHQRLYALDCETTGTDPLADRIVSASVAIVGAGLVTETLTLLADPGVEIPAGATRVHGISTDHAREHGHPSRDVVGVLLETLAARAPGCAVVCCNARFDLTLLDREALRHGVRPLADRELPLHVVDPLVLDRHLDRYRPGKRTLTDLCAHYDAQLDEAHDAAADAIAAARVAWRIGTSGDVVRRAVGREETRELCELRREWDRVRHDLPALHAAQTQWAKEQADGLDEHFRRQGRPEQIDREWPVVTGRLL